MDKMTFHVMIIPTLNCPSNCKYCWGSENTKEIMDISIIDNIIECCYDNDGFFDRESIYDYISLIILENKFKENKSSKYI